MIARCVYLEGCLPEENRQDFFNSITKEIVPLMKSMPGVLSVRVLAAMEIEDEGRDLRITFESIYPSKEAMNFAFSQPIRSQLKAKFNEILPLFKGRVFHITQQVLAEESLK